MNTFLKYFFSVCILGVFVSATHASEQDIDLEETRIEAAELNQLETKVEKVGVILKDINQIVDQIAQRTSAETHVMTGVGQMEDEAIRLNDLVRKIKYKSDLADSPEVTTKALVEAMRIEQEISELRKVLMRVRSEMPNK